jgi:hypothetical protein
VHKNRDISKVNANALLSFGFKSRDEVDDDEGRKKKF